MASKRPAKPRREGRPDHAPEDPTPLALRNVQQRLESVRHARDDYAEYTRRGDLSRRMSAIANFADNAASVKWAINRALPGSPESEAWNAEWKAKLEADPVAQYFYHFRNAAIKRGQVKLGVHLRMQDPGEPEHVVFEESLQDMPREFRNVPLLVLMDQYLDILSRMVASAHLHFGNAT